MEFTLAEIMGMQRGLLILVKMQLPIKLSYNLSKLFNFCSKELVAIEKARIILVKKYSKEVIDKPGEYKVELENEDKFRKEFDSFLEEKVAFDFESIPISAFGDIEISPFDLSGISKIVKDIQ